MDVIRQAQKLANDCSTNSQHIILRLFVLFYSIITRAQKSFQEVTIGLSVETSRKHPAVGQYQTEGRVVQ